MSKTLLRYTFLYLFIIIVIFRNLILGLSDSLPNWGDAAFIAWQIFLMREKILNLEFFSFQDFYTTNAHWPFPLSAVFTDTFIGQAILALPLSFIRNPILLHNIIFLLILFLNYLTAHLFFKRLFKKDLWAFLASFFINNSFFVYDQMIHLQTLNLWPIFLSLKVLSDFYKNSFVKKSLQLALLLTIQFAFSVYLAIFQAAAVSLFFLLEILFSKNRLKTILGFIIFTAVFLFTAYFPLIKPYLEFEKTYHIIRDINEIIQNEGQLTDLFFPIRGTALASLPPIQKFLQFNKNVAAEKLYFPGIVLSLLSLGGIFFQRIKKSKSFLRVENRYTRFDLYMILLMLIGVVFALGPRLKANAQYLEIPLPYLVALKTFPFLHSLRVTHRWIILSLIPLVYFSVRFLQLRRNHLLNFLVIFIFILEAIPLNIRAEKQTYLNKSDQEIQKIVQENPDRKTILLEYPFMNFEKGIFIDYATKNLLSSLYHKAYLVNGYIGVILPEYHKIRLFLEKLFPSPATDGLISSLKVDLIRINKDFLSKQDIQKIRTYYTQQIIFEDSTHILIRPYSVDYLKKNTEIRIKITENPVFLGSDNRFFLNFIFINPTKLWYSNTKNDKLIVRLSFKNQQGKTSMRKTYYQRYPIFIPPSSEIKSTLDFYLPRRYEYVQIQISNPEGRILIKQQQKL